MNWKWNIEKVRLEFEKRNCRLVSKEYVNNKQKLLYIASCGHEHAITIDNFLKGKGDLCKKCRYKKIGNSFKLSYEEVKGVFENQGCHLLSDTYQNSSTKLTYIAQCGHQNQVTLSHFKQGMGRVCNKCSLSIPYEYDYVKEYFENEGCYLLEKEYVNGKTPLKYLATCGHEHVITFDVFKNSPSVSKKCKKCQKVKRYTLEEVANLMKQQGCILLSKEYHFTKPLHYVATCGHERRIQPNKFFIGLGRLCKKCSPAQGERHPQYNKNLTDEERLHNRDLWDIVKWRTAVYERDCYTCQKCGYDKGNKLNAHHINSYNLDKENRFNIENGITLCKDCHQNFHKQFGFGNNTRTQFVAWLKI